MSYVLISGGSGGIGSAIVKRFLREKFHVIVLDKNAYVKPTDIDLNSEEVLFFDIDISNINDIKKLTQKMLNRGITINHFISLAGGSLLEEFDGLEKLDDFLVKKSIEINLTSHITLTRNILPLMKKCLKPDKTICFISSINALLDFGLPAYSAAKSGLLGLTKVLASEFGKYNIRVNSLVPGSVLTEKSLDEPKNYSEYIKASMLGRFATVEEISEAVFRLCVNLTCITGQSIVADCGQSVKGYYENI